MRKRNCWQRGQEMMVLNSVLYARSGNCDGNVEKGQIPHKSRCDKKSQRQQEEMEQYQSVVTCFNWDHKLSVTGKTEIRRLKSRFWEDEVVWTSVEFCMLWVCELIMTQLWGRMEETESSGVLVETAVTSSVPRASKTTLHYLLSIYSIYTATSHPLQSAFKYLKNHHKSGMAACT